MQRIQQEVVGVKPLAAAVGAAVGLVAVAALVAQGGHAAAVVAGAVAAVEAAAGHPQDAAKVAEIGIVIGIETGTEIKTGTGAAAGDDNEPSGAGAWDLYVVKLKAKHICLGMHAVC
jgi:hypothetical protein